VELEEGALANCSAAVRHGVVTMCVGGGQGGVALAERVWPRAASPNQWLSTAHER
jgi:hypothetical protein